MDSFLKGLAILSMSIHLAGEQVKSQISSFSDQLNNKEDDYIKVKCIYLSIIKTNYYNCNLLKKGRQKNLSEKTEYTFMSSILNIEY
jgi:hypothetical protein